MELTSNLNESRSSNQPSARPRGAQLPGRRPQQHAYPQRSPRDLPADHQQVVEEEEVNFLEEFLGPQGAGGLGARHLLQLALLQQPAGVGDDGHRLGGRGGVRTAVPRRCSPRLPRALAGVMSSRHSGHVRGALGPGRTQRWWGKGGILDKGGRAGCVCV